MVESGDVFRCHNWGEGATGNLVVRGQDAAKHPTKHRRTPPTPCQWDDVEKPYIPASVFNPFPAKSVLNIATKLIMIKLEFKI